MSIYIGSWVAPLLVTIGALIIAGLVLSAGSSGGYGGIGDGIVGCFVWLIALVVILISWLVWELA